MKSNKDYFVIKADTVPEISIHEVLLFKNELRKLGAWNQYVHNRCNGRHYIRTNNVDCNAYKSVDRENLIDMMESLKRIISIRYYDYSLPGYFLRNFVDTLVSFDWECTEEGVFFWSKISIKLSITPMNNYLVRRRYMFKS